MASDLEKVIAACKRYEGVLEGRYNASGKGLHEKIDSIASSMDTQVIRDLRLVATVRNKLVHEDGYDRIDNAEAFEAACKRADKALGIKRRREFKRPPLLALVVAGLLLGAGVWILLIVLA